MTEPTRLRWPWWLNSGTHRASASRACHPVASCGAVACGGRCRRDPCPLSPSTCWESHRLVPRGRAGGCADRTSGCPATGRRRGTSSPKPGIEPCTSASKSPAVAVVEEPARPWPVSPSSTESQPTRWCLSCVGTMMPARSRPRGNDAMPSTSPLEEAICSSQLPNQSSPLVGRTAGLQRRGYFDVALDGARC